MWLHRVLLGVGRHTEGRGWPRRAPRRKDDRAAGRKVSGRGGASGCGGAREGPLLTKTGKGVTECTFGSKLPNVHLAPQVTECTFGPLGTAETTHTKTVEPADASASGRSCAVGRACVLGAGKTSGRLLAGTLPECATPMISDYSNSPNPRSNSAGSDEFTGLGEFIEGGGEFVDG